MTDFLEYYRTARDGNELFLESWRRRSIQPFSHRPVRIPHRIAPARPIERILAQDLQAALLAAATDQCATHLRLELTTSTHSDYRTSGITWLDQQLEEAGFQSAEMFYNIQSWNFGRARIDLSLFTAEEFDVLKRAFPYLEKTEEEF